MLDFAKKQGASFLATGHYVKTDGNFSMLQMIYQRSKLFFISSS